MNVLTSALEASVLKFERGNDNFGNERYNFTFHVAKEAHRDELKAALQDLSRSKSIDYKMLDYKPVVPASESGIVGIADGSVVYGKFRVTPEESNPFTVDGKNYCKPLQASEVERLLQDKGRDVRIQLKLLGIAPRAANAQGKGELPYGNVYCDVLWLVPLGTVTKIGNALSAAKIDLKGVADLNLEHVADKVEAAKAKADADAADIEV